MQILGNGMDIENSVNIDENLNSQLDLKKSKKEFSKVGFALAAFLLIPSIVQIIASTLIAKYNPLIIQNSTIAKFVLIFAPIYLCGFPVFLLILRKVKSEKVPRGEVKRLKVSQFFTILVICFAGMYLSSMVSQLLNVIIGSLKGTEVTNPLESLTNLNVWGLAFFVGILAPILEEIVFRGILINKLRKYGEGFCIFASGFAFGLFHGNLSQMIYAFVLGCIFAYVALKTGTIIYGIIMHMIINLIGSVVMLNVVLSQKIYLLILVGVFVLSIIVAGITLFFLNLKKINIKKSNDSVATSKKIGSFVGSAGMIIFMVVVLISVIFSIFGEEILQLIKVG